jgi:type IV pilus assembly protein PilW
MSGALQIACRIRGFTLVELMLGTLIGALLITGALRLLVQARIAWQAAENVAALEERAAYALTALEQDIRLAGYWGLHSDSKLISVQPDVAAHCGGIDVSNWALDLSSTLQADNNRYTLPCKAYSGAVSGTDTLTVRHASLAPADPAEDRIQLYTSRQHGMIFQAKIPPATAAGIWETYNVEVHAWHLVQNSSETGLPALRRFALSSKGIMQSQEIIPGIENFQVLLGIDRDEDGVVDGFVNPDATAGKAILAVRFWLLLRSLTREPGHIDAGPWYSIDTNAGSPIRPGDSYRRITAERTIWLRNQADG